MKTEQEIEDTEPCVVCGNERRGQGGYLTCECPRVTPALITIKAKPSRAAVLDFASRALRNAPEGTVTPGLLNALVEDIKDGLHCLQND